MCFFFQISRVTPSWAKLWECRQTSLTTILSYYEGHYNMFKILRPKRTYYFDNIVAPSAYIKSKNIKGGEVGNVFGPFYSRGRLLCDIM